MTNHARLRTLGPLTVDEAPAGSRELLESTSARLGMVPNMYAVMANSPSLLDTYLSGYEKFRRGSGFSPTEQEVAFLTISRFHSCTYCVGVHSAVADLSRVPTEITDALRAGGPVADAKLAALVEFTETMLASRGRPSPEQLNAFVSAGYTERHALEIILAIAVKTISNYTNHLFDTPLDPQFAHRSWTPA